MSAEAGMSNGGQNEVGHAIDEPRELHTVTRLWEHLHWIPHAKNKNTWIGSEVPWSDLYTCNCKFVSRVETLSVYS